MLLQERATLNDYFLFWKSGPVPEVIRVSFCTYLNAAGSTVAE